MSIAVFGQAKDGREVQAITLQAGDLTARVLTLGAVLQDVRLAGVAHSLTIGGNSVAAYEGPMGYCGAVVGPVANRIDGARAVIAGKTCNFAEKRRPRPDPAWRADRHGRAELADRKAL